MSSPKCPQNGPYGVELEAGAYFWCSCGLSDKQPFCDGSHKGSDFTPVKFEVTETAALWLCGCKRSDKGNYLCDGSHKTVESD
jgi:CDGSH iron-sulfur domain-containing protein 3